MLFNTENQIKSYYEAYILKYFPCKNELFCLPEFRELLMSLLKTYNNHILQIVTVRWNKGFHTKIDLI